MRIYTGYWSKYSKYIDDGLVPVRISGLMSWMGIEYRKCPCLEYLRPTLSMVTKYKQDKNINEYVTEYNKILRTHTPRDIIIDLTRISFNNENKDVILMCFERPGEFCHRNLVANYLNNILKEKIVEYGIN